MKKVWNIISSQFVLAWCLLVLFLPYGKIGQEIIWGPAAKRLLNSFGSVMSSGQRIFYAIIILATLIINMIHTYRKKKYLYDEISCFNKKARRNIVFNIISTIAMLLIVFSVNKFYNIKGFWIYLIIISLPIFSFIALKIDPIYYKKSNEDIFSQVADDPTDIDKKRLKKGKRIFIVAMALILTPIYFIKSLPIMPNSYIYFSEEYATAYGAYFGINNSDKLLNNSDVYNGGAAIGLDELLGLTLGDFSIEAYGFNDWHMYGSTSLELGKSHTYVYYSDNIKYYNQLLEKIDKEIEEILYGNADDYDTKEEFEQGIKKIENLNDRKIQIEENKNKLRYEYIKVTYHVQKMEYVDVKVLDEVIYDTNCQNGNKDVIKWGKQKNWFIYPVARENIFLSQNEFVKGTDFTNEKIGVKIFYNDGSMKLTYIIPDNAKELNNLGKGKHKIKWSDEWGSYEKEIKII